MNPLQGTEALEDLIQQCLECGLIDSCEQNEEGTWVVTEDKMTYWLAPGQAHPYLERLLRDRSSPEGP